MRGSWLVVMTFAAGCVVSAALWRFWTPQCNEACPEWVALSMIGFVAVFPLACLAAGAAVAAKRYATQTSWALFTVFVAGAAALITMLTYSAK